MVDFWIRSQDGKRITNVSDLYIVHDQVCSCDYIGNNIVGHLGKYKTGRAMQILDEINEIKYYKYMASLDWSAFARSVLLPKPEEEQKLLLAMMNTYQMPSE